MVCYWRYKRETENGINLEIIGDKSPRGQSYIHGIDGCMDLRIFNNRLLVSGSY